MKNIDRDNKIVSLFKCGNTMQDVGMIVGLTRERVRQILVKNNIQIDCGGVKIRSILKRKMADEINANKWLPGFGCTRKELKKILSTVSEWKKIKWAYWRQKKNAGTRGIIFNLTFPEWFKIWDESGQIHNMGVHKGQYVMARNMDEGSYSVGNVKIITTEQNVKEYYCYKHGKKVSP